MADVAEGVPPDVGRVQPELGHVVLDAGLVVVAHLKSIRYLRNQIVLVNTKGQFKMRCSLSQTMNSI